MLNHVSGAHVSAAASAAGAGLGAYGSDSRPRVSGAHMSAAEPGGRNIVRLLREQAMLNRE